MQRKLLDKLPGKASEKKAVLFLRQLAFPHQYQQVTCPSPVLCELPLVSSASSSFAISSSNTSAICTNSYPDKFLTILLHLFLSIVLLTHLKQR